MRIRFAVLVASVLFGCSGVKPAPAKVAPPRPLPSVAGARGGAGAGVGGEAVAGGGPVLPAGVKDCGQYEDVRQVDAARDARNEAVYRCFDEGVRARQPVAFTLVQVTTEGGPIYTLFRATGDGRIVLEHDTTHDKFGPQAVTRRECAAVVRMADRSIEAQDCSPPVAK